MQRSIEFREGALPAILEVVARKIRSAAAYLIHGLLYFSTSRMAGKAAGQKGG